VIGEELGSYRVIEPIGKGGMASVFIGEHSVLGHRVAIKVLHQANPDNPMVERRFINEAKAIAAIRHPGIVELFDFGRGPDGRAYIVMELLNGETLRNRLRRGALPVRQALVFARQIASAVAVAHDAHIIHRDLKPDNIFLVPDAEVEYGERIKVLDFGVAKQMSMARAPSEQTATGVLIGTPAYMSPEQCKGTGEIDHRADIYSLGIVLYRMVTGQLPFESAGTGELIGKHIYEEPATAHEIDPDIPEEVSDLIARCMEKNPKDRFTDMHAVIDSLREFLDDDDEYDTIRPQPPVVENAERGPVGKGPHEDDELTRPTTLRAMTGQAFADPDADTGRWAWPLTIVGVVALAAFAALLVVTTGDEVRVPGEGPSSLQDERSEIQPAAVVPVPASMDPEPAPGRDSEAAKVEVAEPTTAPAVPEPAVVSAKNEPPALAPSARASKVDDADGGMAADVIGEVELEIEEAPATDAVASAPETPQSKPAAPPERPRSPSRTVRKTESEKPKNPKNIRVPALY